MESLCILTHEYVWEISVNLHVIDYDGNILDCANLAALCALAHFRYPAVTVTGTDVQVVRRRLFVRSISPSSVASDARTKSSNRPNASFSDHDQFCIV